MIVAARSAYRLAFISLVVDDTKKDMTAMFYFSDSSIAMSVIMYHYAIDITIVQ